ncbi:MAG: hypothetical protein L3I99_08255 [Sulfurimonas sp.]|nr:hypothetical protein [Sulfurimonas sp.]
MKNKIIQVEDKKLESLRKHLKSLEYNLEVLNEEKLEYTSSYDEFNIQHNVVLADIIKKILELKNKINIAKIKKLKEDKDSAASNDEKEKLEDELKEARNNYEDTKKDYDDFSSEYEAFKELELENISDDDKKDLKRLYRLSCKLCHPDIVETRLQEKALRLMQELNEAYSKKDLQTVKRIFDNLNNGLSFDVASDTITDIDKLISRIDEMLSIIEDVRYEIEVIKLDDLFEVVVDSTKWDEYLDNQLSVLEDEYGVLSKGVI